MAGVALEAVAGHGVAAVVVAGLDERLHAAIGHDDEAGANFRDETAAVWQFPGPFGGSVEHRAAGPRRVGRIRVRYCRAPGQRAGTDENGSQKEMAGEGADGGHGWTS